MKAPMAVLREGLGNLRQQLNIARAMLDAAEIEFDIQHAEHQVRIRSLQSLIRLHATEFRLHQYRSTIVAVYGHLEKYVGSLIELGVSRIGALSTNYADLPVVLREHHLLLTLEVLQRRNDPRFQGIVTAEDLIARLHACQAGDAHFTLNTIVFTHHTANFRHEVTKSLLIRAGFDLAAVDDSPGLTSAMSEKFPDAERYWVINDLAQRRNEVSHGEVGNTLAFPLLFDYIDVVEAYCLALASSVVESLARFAISHHGISLGTPDIVFDNHIVGFESARGDLLLGDLLGYRRGDGRCALSHIQSLQVEGASRQQTAAGERIGLSTGLRCNCSTELFLMPSVVGDLDGAEFEVLT